MINTIYIFLVLFWRIYNKRKESFLAKSSCQKGSLRKGRVDTIAVFRLFEKGFCVNEKNNNYINETERKFLSTCTNRFEFTSWYFVNIKKLKHLITNSILLQGTSKYIAYLIQINYCDEIH